MRSSLPTLPRRLTLAGVFALALATGGARAEPVPPKVLAALESRTVRVRVTAVVAVAKSGDPNARVILQGMLRDEAEAVRAAAVEGLGRIGDPAALPAVEQARKDKSPLVQRLAAESFRLLEAKRKLLAAKPEPASPPDRAKRNGAGRQAKAVPAPGATLVEIGPARDYTGKAPGGALEALRKLVGSTVRTNGRRAVQVEGGGVDKGYELLLSIRSIKPFAQEGVSGLEVRCELTVVELPQKALRLSLSASAAAGVEGALDEATRASLVTDAIDACAPALGKDFSDWLAQR